MGGCKMKEEQLSPYTNNIFEQRWWLEAVAPDTQWQEEIVRKDDEVVARWMIPAGNSFIMPPLTQTMGYWLSDKVASINQEDERKELINKLIKSLHKEVDICLAPENSYFLPFYWAGFTVKPRVTYRINDLSNLDAIYDSFWPILKKRIKSAGNKVSVEESDDTDMLYVLLQKTFKRQQKSFHFSRERLRHIYEVAKAHEAVKLLFARDHEGNVHSGVLFLYDEKVCYYLMTGNDPEYRKSAANSLLLWEGIKFASKHSQCFDFEGSMIEGVETFVRQFGGNMTVYYQVSRMGFLKTMQQQLKLKVKKLIHY